MGHLTVEDLHKLSEQALNPASGSSGGDSSRGSGGGEKNTFDVEKGDNSGFEPIPSLLARFGSGVASLLGVILIGALLCAPAWPIVW